MIPAYNQCKLDMTINNSSEIEIFRENANKLISQSQFLIAAETEKNKLESIGTCILIKLDNRYFLITAAHVINQRHNVKCKELYLLLDSETGKEKILIEEEIVCDPNDKVADYHDVAIIELNKENYKIIPDERFLTLEQIELDDSDKKKIYAFSGYPVSKNKSIRTQGKNKFLVVFTEAFEDDIFTFSLSYDKSNFNQELIKPQGMSGGGAWVISNKTNLEPKLIGISVCYKSKKYVVVLKISYVLSMIKGFFIGTILDTIDLPFKHIEEEDGRTKLLVNEDLVSKYTDSSETLFILAGSFSEK